MHKYSFKKFFEEDTGGAGGATGAESASGLNPFEAAPPTDSVRTEDAPPAADSGHSSSPPQHTRVDAPPTGQAPPAAAPPAQPTPGYDPEKLAAAVAAAVARTQPVLAPAAAAPVQALSPQEVDQLFKVYHPDEATIAQIFAGGPTGVKALEAALHKTAEMGATIAAHFAQKQLKSLEDRVMAQLGPVSQTIAQQREAQAISEHTAAFYQRYPHLQAHEPVLQMVYNNLLAQKFQGTVEEVYKKVAETAETVIKQINPNAFAGGAAAPARQPQPNGRPRMTPLPSGGSGGLGGTHASGDDRTNFAKRMFEGGGS